MSRLSKALLAFTLAANFVAVHALAATKAAKKQQQCVDLAEQALHIDEILDDLAIVGFGNVSAEAYANSVNAILAFSGMKRIDIGKYQNQSQQKQNNILRTKLYAARANLSKKWNRLSCSL